MQSEDYPKLRECPFCGNEYPMITETSMGVQITCPSCQSKFRCDCTAGHDYRKSETVKHWNRRAQPANEPLTHCGECMKYQTPDCAAKHAQALTDFCSHGVRKPEGSENG